MDFSKAENIIFVAAMGVVTLAMLAFLLAHFVKGKHKTGGFDIFVRIFCVLVLIVSLALSALAVFTMLKGDFRIETEDGAAYLISGGEITELPVPALFAALSELLGAVLCFAPALLSLIVLIMSLALARKNYENKSPAKKQKAAPDKRTPEQKKRDAEIERIRRLASSAVKKTSYAAGTESNKATESVKTDSAKTKETVKANAPELENTKAVKPQENTSSESTEPAQSESVDWRVNQPKPMGFVGLRDSDDDLGSFDEDDSVEVYNDIDSFIKSFDSPEEDINEYAEEVDSEQPIEDVDNTEEYIGETDNSDESIEQVEQTESGEIVGEEDEQTEFDELIDEDDQAYESGEFTASDAEQSYDFAEEGETEEESEPVEESESDEFAETEQEEYIVDEDEDDELSLAFDEPNEYSSYNDDTSVDEYNEADEQTVETENNAPVGEDFESELSYDDSAEYENVSPFDGQGIVEEELVEQEEDEQGIVDEDPIDELQTVAEQELVEEQAESEIEEEYAAPSEEQESIVDEIYDNVETHDYGEEIGSIEDIEPNRDIYIPEIRTITKAYGEQEEQHTQSVTKEPPAPKPIERTIPSAPQPIREPITERRRTAGPDINAKNAHDEIVRRKIEQVRRAHETSAAKRHEPERVVEPTRKVQPASRIGASSVSGGSRATATTQQTRTVPTSKSQQQPTKKLPLTRRYVIIDRTNAVNVFNNYLKERGKDKLDSMVNTIILK